MTGLLLLGLAGAGGPPRAAAEDHERLCAPGFDALTVALDSLPEDRDTEAWAVAAAVAQNTVLSVYAAEEDVLPVALGAAFSGADALFAHLENRAAELRGQMDALAGKTEYILQLLPDRTPAPETGDTAPATGAAFLQRRRAARDLRLNRARDSHAFAETACADIAARALQAARRPVKAGGPVLDLSVLIARSEAAALLDHARTLSEGAADHGLRVRVIGPCAPHSFLAGREACDA